MLVELKNGDTYNGRLVNCDSWMNINLKEVLPALPVVLEHRGSESLSGETPTPLARILGWRNLTTVSSSGDLHFKGW